MIDKRFALFGALLCIPALAGGQPVPEAGESASSRQYTVEIILFRYADSVSSGTEMFVPDALEEPAVLPDDGIDDFGTGLASVPEFSDRETRPEPVPLDADGSPLRFYDADGNPIPFDRTVALFDENGNPVGFDSDGNPVFAELRPTHADYVLLLDDELTLGTTWDRLERLSAYEPFAHIGWTQRLVPYDDPIAIDIDDLMAPVAGFDGDFTLYLSRFLHLIVNLEQNADPAEVDVVSDPYRTSRGERFVEPLPYESYRSVAAPTFYRINEDRIFKSGDLRYFDHPRLGVLAKIERVVEPEPEEEALPPGSTPPSEDAALR